MFIRKTFATLAFMAFASSSALAQSTENKNMEAFRNLGVGVEVGLMGASVQVSMPVVSNHLVVVLGYNFPNVSVNADFDISSGDICRKIDELNGNINNYNAQTSGIPGHQKIDNLSYPNKDIAVDVDAKFNLGAAKVLLEYYPSAKHSFHITAGMFVGQSEFVKINGTADREWWQTYMHAIDINNNQLPEQYRINNLENVVRFSIDDRTFQVSPDSDGKIEFAAKTNTVKPYLGIGFGRAIPKHRVGFQFELGAWMHGKPELVSSSEVAYDPSADGVSDIMKTVNKIQFWPQMTFRLTGRIL